MASTTTFYTEISATIVVNGVTMDITEYRKLRRSLAPKKPKCKRKKHTEITIIPEAIKTMMKGARVIKSLNYWYENGYAQWGNIAKFILDMKEIRKPFVLFRSRTKELNETLAEIERLAKRNSKSVYEYLEKASWQIEDLEESFVKLLDGISNSHVCDIYANHECINGRGRRLGLKELMSRSMTAINSMENTIKELNKVYQNR